MAEVTLNVATGMAGLETNSERLVNFHKEVMDISNPVAKRDPFVFISLNSN